MTGHVSPAPLPNPCRPRPVAWLLGSQGAIHRSLRHAGWRVNHRRSMEYVVLCEVRGTEGLVELDAEDLGSAFDLARSWLRSGLAEGVQVFVVVNRDGHLVDVIDRITREDCA
jgi:hypothetical protein